MTVSPWLDLRLVLVEGPCRRATGGRGRKAPAEPMMDRRPRRLARRGMKGILIATLDIMDSLKNSDLLRQWHVGGGTCHSIDQRSRVFR